MYTLLELGGARGDGAPVAVQAETELGRNVYSTFVDIPPGGSVQLQLDLAGVVEGPYRFNAPVQPFANADRLTVTVDRPEGGPVASRQGKLADGRVTWSTTLDLPRSLSVTDAEPD
jgi:hypothetical protein